VSHRCFAGVVGCALLYKDINITSHLQPGKRVRVCNDAWRSFAVFDKVAVMRGSALASSLVRESDAVGLLQVLKQVDSLVTPKWLLDNLQCSDSKKRLVTPSGTSIIWQTGCCDGAVNCTEAVKTIKTLTLEFDAASLGLAGNVAEAIRILPALDEELVAGLRSLPDLRDLHLMVGSGTLLPQLASLSNLETLHIKYYCLRGTIPSTLVAGLPRLAQFGVLNVERAVGATDPAGGLCGLSGTLPNMRLLDKTSTGKYSYLDLSFNQLTGQLPAGLLALAQDINLSHNRFSGSIPGITTLGNASVQTPMALALNDNSLQVGTLKNIYVQEVKPTKNFNEMKKKPTKNFNSSRNSNNT
jgi:hypothetical protein